MRLAVIDVGTNSAKLLIAEQNLDSSLRPIHEDQRMIRLGEGLHASGGVSERATERLVQALQEFRAVADRWNAKRCLVVGTSASRDSGNSLIKVVQERTGLQYQILSGEQEAEISFEGAVHGVPDLQQRIISCDIGGGSTEFVEGEPGRQIYSRKSLDIGSVRITERHFRSLPPIISEVQAARRWIQQELAELSFSESSETILVGASDTQRLLLDLQHRLVTEKRSIKYSGISSAWKQLEEHGSQSAQLSLVQVEIWLECLLQMTASDILDLDVDKLHGRADIFPAAVLIFSEVMKSLGHKSITVSPWGLRHGLALRFFHTRQI